MRTFWGWTLLIVGTLLFASVVFAVPGLVLAYWGFHLLTTQSQ